MADAAAPVRKPRRKATPSSTGNLAGQLAATLAESLLPDERAAISPERIADAARFTHGVLAQRLPGTPAVAIESVGGRTGERFMRIAIVNDDMPFLVDSVAALVADRGLAIEWLAHPVLTVERDQNGKLKGLAGTTRESVIYLETPRADARERRELAAALATVLGDVYAAVADWPKMQSAIEADAQSIVSSDPEGAALLRWLGGGMLTQLGHVTRRRDGGQSGLLGICRKSARTPARRSVIRPGLRVVRPGNGKAGGKGKSGVAVPLIIKANRIANVHRRVPLDLFIVPLLEGSPNGQMRVTALSGPCRGLDERSARGLARPYPAPA